MATGTDMRILIGEMKNATKANTDAILSLNGTFQKYQVHMERRVSVVETRGTMLGGLLGAVGGLGATTVANMNDLGRSATNAVTSATLQVIDAVLVMLV